MTSASKLLVFLFACFLLSFFSSIHAKCLGDQRSYLLSFGNAVVYYPADSIYRSFSWNESTDCCKWEGVVCDDVGHVISLYVPNKRIKTGSNEDWKSIFRLQYLEELQLSGSSFGGIAFPEELYNLTRLKYLNLSRSGFMGQIPIGLSKLTSLVTLDLSYNQLAVLKHPRVLFQNLTQLKQLYLNTVYVSAGGNALGNVLSSLSKLQVLSLTYCGLSGPILPSLSNLSSITTIKLDGNSLDSTILFDYLSNFTNLKILSLSHTSLLGQFPEQILEIPTLEILDLSANPLLGGSLPQQFPKTGSLKEMTLWNTNFSGSLPDSIGHLKDLSELDLSNSGFSGAIPSSLFALPSLQYLFLSNNYFDGEIEEFQNASSSSLVRLYLNNNNFIGSIPKSFFYLKSLERLYLSFNSFNGTFGLEMFNKLKNLYALDISHNNLSMDASCSTSSTCFSSFSQISILGLASCNLKKFPDLRNQSEILELDLSLNSITGEIPNWIWTISPSWSLLNLSCNLLVGLQKPYLLPVSLEVLDLHANLLKGEIPIPRLGDWLPWYVDYSNNNFNTSIPSNIGEYIPHVQFFSLSHNNIQGDIPKSICNGISLEVLDLSNNFLRGKIPKCLFGTVYGVLNLAGNKLGGYISNTFQHNCSLRTLDLSRNSLRGKIPTSLANCKSLQVLNVGNNNLEDNFPCTLMKSLIVLVLQSNMFHGEINCSWGIHSLPSLQILDVSYNNFSGALSPQLFLNCRGMIVVNSTEAPPLQYHISHTFGTSMGYRDSVKLVMKGFKVELVKILTIYKTLDFSCNNFQGNIPITIGELQALYSLNLSHNALTGIIPKSFGKLEQLGSLDLSTNQLTGRVPSELGDLTFLSVLNLSYNQLIGKIPDGRQLRTFSNSSFLGNKGLCSFPLTVSCDHGLPSNGSSVPGGASKNKKIDWEFVSAALGFSVGIGIILWMNFLNPAWWRRFNSLIIEFLFLRVFGVDVLERSYRNPIRRV